MSNSWNSLYKSACEVLNAKTIMPFLSYGNSACAILSNDNIYTGISINSNEHIGSCAEQNAIISMLKNGDNNISKIVIVNELEEIINPCQDCIIQILELSNNEAEILQNLKPLNTKKVKELLPDWWGTYHQ